MLFLLFFSVLPSYALIGLMATVKHAFYAFFFFLVIEYEVVVYTGAYNDENTNFDIFIVIEGEKGDTGKRYLEVSLDTAFRSKSVSSLVDWLKRNKIIEILR